MVEEWVPIFHASKGNCPHALGKILRHAREKRGGLESGKRWMKNRCQYIVYLRVIALALVRGIRKRVCLWEKEAGRAKNEAIIGK